MHTPSSPQQQAAAVHDPVAVQQRTATQVSVAAQQEQAPATHLHDPVAMQQSEIVADNTGQNGREPEACVACGKTASDLGHFGLMRCGACTIGPLYCNEVCQRACWKSHKEECMANRI